MELKNKFIAYQTIVMNELKRTFRLWAQTILPPAITTLLYFLIFGTLMGRRIGSMAGLSYVDFIVPGLIMMTMLMAAFNASVHVVYVSKWTKIIEEILVSPMSTLNILLSYLSVGIFRGLIVGIIVSCIAMFFAHFRINNIIYMLFVAVISCAIFSLIGILNALVAKNFDQVSIIPTFVITPLSYLGGVFYSLNILPEFWQKIALFNPVVYIISTFRYAFYGHSDTNILLSTFFMLLIFGGLFALALYWLKIRKGISD